MTVALLLFAVLADYLQGATADRHYVYVVSGNSLARIDGADYGLVADEMSQRSTVAIAPRLSAWQRAGVYTLELTGATVGTTLAAALGVATIEAVYQAGYNGPNSVPAAGVYCLTSAVLSAAGTYCLGRLVTRRGTFKRALSGGAVGGLAGGLAFVDYFTTRRHPHKIMMPLGLALPALGAVVAYNGWAD